VTRQQSKRESVSASPAQAIGLRGYRIRDVAKTEERRREILMGAARVFAYGGYDATSMDQIGLACGLTKGHIYHYFRSKEEIFTEIRAAAVSSAIVLLEPIMPLAKRDPEQALRTAISSLIARVFEREGQYEPVLPDPISLSSESRKRIRSLSQRYEQMFADILRAGIDQGVFVSDDPKLMTFVILRAANTVADWYREGGKWKPKWIIETVTEQLVRGVKA
jgi:TetR/AcrR family transcriptional regulator, cholesterol catabolism regulator